MLEENGRQSVVADSVLVEMEEGKVVFIDSGGLNCFPLIVSEAFGHNGLEFWVVGGGRRHFVLKILVAFSFNN